MNQTPAMSLGIFGLNEDFVQVNEVMNFIALFLYLVYLFSISIYK
jgi:hypothetical protein